MKGKETDLINSKIQLLETKNKGPSIKDSLDKSNKRFSIAEEKIHEPEHRSAETTQNVAWGNK